MLSFFPERDEKKTRTVIFVGVSTISSTGSGEEEPSLKTTGLSRPSSLGVKGGGVKLSVSVLDDEVGESFSAVF